MFRLAKTVLLTLSVSSTSAFAAGWINSTGYDCQVTCEMAGEGAPWRSGTTPGGNSVWNNREILLCKAHFPQAGTTLYGFNFKRRAGATAGSDICHAGYGNVQVNATSFSCRCS